MQIKRFQLFLLTLIAVASASIQTIQAVPPLDKAPYYEEIYEVLKDGSIVATQHLHADIII